MHRTLSRLQTKNLVLVDAVRTPFLRSHTQYADLMPHDLLRMAISGLSDRLDEFDINEVEYVCAGTVFDEVKTTNVAREAWLSAGLSENTPAHTVSQACISANTAVASCLAHINMDQAKICLAGGVETVSDVQIKHSPELRQELLKSQKFKSNMDYVKLAGRTVKNYKTYLKPDWPEVVQEFSTKEIMGHSCDRLCEVFGITREDQDSFAMRSHRGAKDAFEQGLMTDLLSVAVGGTTISRDNGTRIVPPEKMAKLKPVFRPDVGTVTGGNSSFFTDGASACLIGEENYVKAKDLPCRAYLREWVFVAQDPKDELLLGPAYAIPKVLKRAGLTIENIDVVEIHEAFAGQVLSCLSAMESENWSSSRNQAVTKIDREKVNRWGGSLSIGHPFGATGVRLIAHAANRLKHEDGKYALIAACAAGGHGHAAIVERHPDY